MKKLLVIVVLFLQLQANDREITLLDFTELLSAQNNINVYIDEDLKSKEVSLFVPENIKNDDLLFLYRESVKKLGYELINFNNTYYLLKIQNSSLYSYFIDLKYNSFEAVSKFLTFKDVKFQYVDTTNTIIIHCLQSQYFSLVHDIKKIDFEKKQVTLKFTIIEINEDELKEQGFTHSTLYTSATGEVQNVLNTFVLPFQSKNPIFTSPNFYGALKLFSESKFFNVSQNPFILVQDSKEFNFSAVNNIPYRKSNTITQAANVSEQTSIDYKDVGLKINGKSFVFEDYINLDLDLIIEDILSVVDNVPTTFKRQLKSNTNLKYGEVLLLSGIKQNKKSKDNFEIPFFSSIPYLGEAFKYKKDTSTNSNISIAIEVIK
ncbi:MAG: hypothetical protein PHQ93_02995 [Sulfurimonas sp.]|uniref:type II secretion system protein GspD n=1 Tax=Sulfurimonas sp. TaxID=2022749 RepID=UPI002632EC69|nr:hypothetical protein [Sulfurimonas sp.]MDD5400138.1 hypothetical protein [Sulfurimonas sp.]